MTVPVVYSFTIFTAFIMALVNDLEIAVISSCIGYGRRKYLDKRRIGQRRLAGNEGGLNPALGDTRLRLTGTAIKLQQQIAIKTIAHYKAPLHRTVKFCAIKPTFGFIST